jgi:hypothetical protein
MANEGRSSRTPNFVPVSALDERRPSKVALIRELVRQAEESEPGKVRTPKKKKPAALSGRLATSFFTATEAVGIGSSVCAPAKARNSLAATEPRLNLGGATGDAPSLQRR